MATIAPVPKGLPVSSQARPSSLAMADVYGSYVAGAATTAAAGSSGASRVAAATGIGTGAPVDVDVTESLRGLAILCVGGLVLLGVLSYLEG